MHGQVVQAVQGQRQHYQPIRSQLTDSHQLLDVVAAILQVYAFDCVYIADLNAITGNTALPDHRVLIQQVIKAFPEIRWWVDAGVQAATQLPHWLDIGVRPVLASEAMHSLSGYQQMIRHAPEGILSLDFFQDGFHGPDEVLANQHCWTQPTIVMSLPSVGANRGPDVAQIQAMKQRYPIQHLYAAGGVRHLQDIQALETAGATGVLVASALHQRRLFQV